MFVAFLQRLRPLQGLPVWLRYLLTGLIVLFCFAVRNFLVGLDPDENRLPLYLVFVPAVIVSALAFDRGSGFVAVALSAAGGLFFFTEPHQSFMIAHAGDAVRLVVFVVVGLLTASLVEALRATVEQLEETRRSLAADYMLLSAADEQKALLLADLNHRVKNHLQSLIALVSGGARKTGDLEAAELLRSTAARLGVLGTAYDRLHMSKDAAVLDAPEFIGGLCSDLKNSVGDLKPISIRVDVDAVELDSNSAVTIGLIINELVTNSLKYAFREDREGQIDVSLKRDEGSLSLVVSDDGIGMGQTRDGGSGQRLVRALARQLGGQALWTSLMGTKVQVQFPAPDPRRRIF